MQASDPSASLPGPVARRDHDRVTVCLFGAFFAPLTDAEARALIEQLQTAIAYPAKEVA